MINNLFLFYIRLNKPIKFNTGLPNLFTRITNWLNSKTCDYNTNLHRWCHKNSFKYKDSCNISKKIDYANNDNSF